MNDTTTNKLISSQDAGNLTEKPFILSSKINQMRHRRDSPDYTYAHPQ
jgi:hypothetical protein